MAERRYAVVLRTGTRLTLSRGYREKLQERLGRGTVGTGLRIEQSHVTDRDPAIAYLSTFISENNRLARVGHG